MRRAENCVRNDVYGARQMGRARKSASNIDPPHQKVNCAVFSGEDPLLFARNGYDSVSSIWHLWRIASNEQMACLVDPASKHKRLRRLPSFCGGTSTAKAVFYPRFRPAEENIKAACRSAITGTRRSKESRHRNGRTIRGKRGKRGKRGERAKGRNSC